MQKQKMTPAQNLNAKMKNKLISIIALTLLSPTLALAQSAVTTNTTQTVLGRVSTFGDYISLIWSFGSQVILALAVFFIILGAFFYIASAGDERRIDQGKQMIFGSLIAMVIVILSGVLIRTLHKPAEGTSGNLTDVPQVINNASTILLTLIGAFTVAMFIYAGFLFITAQGDVLKTDKAKSALRFAVIGLIVGVSAFAIVRTVLTYLT